MPILDTPPTPALTTRPAWTWADYHAEHADGRLPPLLGCCCRECRQARELQAEWKASGKGGA